MYFKYHTFIKDFELNRLQRAMRLWATENLAGKKEKNDESSTKRRIISKKVNRINHHIGNLLFNKGGQY
ncbi:8795_t:CDS:1, partial [Funneliformis mosseae]